MSAAYWFDSMKVCLQVTLEPLSIPILPGHQHSDGSCRLSNYRVHSGGKRTKFTRTSGRHSMAVVRVDERADGYCDGVSCQTSNT